LTFRITFSLIIFVFGLGIGSFLNCVIYRMEMKSKEGITSFSQGRPRRKAFGFLRGKSFCPHCKHTLGWQDLVPIFSFLALKGKCRYCQKKISWQYPLVEIATGLLFLLIFNFQLTENSSLLANRELFSVLSFQNLLAISFFFLLSSFLIIVFVYDLKHYIIPDKIIFPAIAIVLIYNFFQLIANRYPLSTVLNNLYAALGAAGFFLLIVLISRGKWMGIGDIKLAFFMGLFLGYPGILVALFSAFLIGAIIGVGLIMLKKKGLKSEVPFGPFLVIGTFIALFWGQAITNWYLNLFISAI